MSPVTVWNVFSSQGSNPVGRIERETSMIGSPLTIYNAMGQKAGRAEITQPHGAWEIRDSDGRYLGQCYGFLDPNIHDADDRKIGYSFDRISGGQWKSDVQVYLLEADEKTLQGSPVGHLNRASGDYLDLWQIAGAAALLLLLPK